MDPTQAQIEEALMAVIEGIYSSSIIPEDHKDAYVEYLEKNGITEKMLTELEKVFQKEKEGFMMTLEEKLVLRKELEDMIIVEQKKNDRPQAEIVAAVEEFTERKSQEMKQSLDEIEQEITTAIEDSGKESETTEIEKIRAELAKSKNAA